MHRFIVYQYGKVGSTSVVNALNQLPESEAFQSHFLGEPAFSDTLQRLQDPAASDYVFEHSAGQLIENLRIYRHYLRRETNTDRLTVISLAREPFDWFRSCISQDIGQHLGALKTQLDKQGISFSGEAELVKLGMKLVFSRLLQAVEHLGSVDELSTDKRFTLREVLTTADQQDFRAFMFFLHMFIRPHIWFSSHFQRLLEIEIKELEPIAQGVFRHRKNWGNIYLIRYEDLSSGFPRMLTDLGFAQNIPLPYDNTSESKLLHTQLELAFTSTQALKLKSVCHSRDSQFLGY